MDILAVAGAYAATICPLLLVVLLLGGVLKITIFAPAKVQRPSANPSVQAHRERTQR